MLPTTDSKLLARWQGPYEIVQQTRTVDYEVYWPEQQIYHVNLLKAWQTQECLIAEGAEEWGSSGAGLGGEQPVPMGEGLTEVQTRQARALKHEFPDVFSAKPGLTHVTTSPQTVYPYDAGRTT